MPLFCRPAGGPARFGATARVAAGLLLGALVALGAAPAGAGAGGAVLTVTLVRPGAAQPEVRALDLAALERLPHRRLRTTTIWTRGPQRFEGVLLRDLLDWLGVRRDATIEAHAINDYTTRIPAADASDPGPIIAYRRNGALMPLRENGPLWIIYPYDADPRWQTEVVYSRSIWQLDHMTITSGQTGD